MSDPFFISYSRADAQSFAVKLADELQAGPPPISLWLDRRQIKPGQDWDEQIAEALKKCEALVFVMTRDSVEPKSMCKREWVRALKYKKPIVPLMLHADAEMPFQLEPRQYIDFTGAYDTALAQLRNHLQWLTSPEGALQALKDRLEDARRDLTRATDPIETARITDEIAQLQKQIAEQQRLVDHPQAAAQQTTQNIQTGLERERQPEKPIGGTTHTKFINPPPTVAPDYFQDRKDESNKVGKFLKDEAKRLLTIDGRGGIGKTAVVCRLLKSVESGHLPDDQGLLSVDGIVYLSASGSRRINVPNLYADLCQLLPGDKAQSLEAIYKDPQASTDAKVRTLLNEFPQGRVVVLLDNFEDLIDSGTAAITDAELNDALQTILNAPQHAIKVILTTRIAPHDLLLLQPARQSRIPLGQGLPFPYAENILREMDGDGLAGLNKASDELLGRAREYTRGYPRALEALYAILSADRYTTLEEVLSGPPPKNVVEALVGEAFNRLDPTAQKVMGALAVYERPVTPAAIDYLLQAYLPGINSAPALNRLVNMQFVRKEGSRYYQHAVDRAYALSRIPKGDVSDREDKGDPLWTQYALLHRGAEYFKQARQPRETWKKLDDLSPQLNEFELRYAGEDYDTAASVLLEIDYDYLLLWGQYRLMMELHERLQGKIDDQSLQQRSVGNLGSTNYRTGQIQRAIRCYEHALTIARDRKDKQGEGAWLGNLGLCYSDLGQTTRAIEFYEQALTIVREFGDRRSEEAALGNLGSCYHDLGQTTRAIEYHEQALTIDREIRDRGGEGADLTNLGNRYAELGQTARALKYYEQALVIAREIGDRFVEGGVLCNLAEVLVDAGHYVEAIHHARESIKIGDEIGSPGMSCYSNAYLSLAQLYANDLSAARTSAESACRHYETSNNHYASALLGLIALRQGERLAAGQTFTETIAYADQMLGQTPRFYNAIDAKGLAFCGLALCGDAARVHDAMAAYRAARAINKDAGVVMRVLRLFDAVVVVDTEGILKDVRSAAAGE